MPALFLVQINEYVNNKGLCPIYDNTNKVCMSFDTTGCFSCHSGLLPRMIRNRNGKDKQLYETTNDIL